MTKASATVKIILLLLLSAITTISIWTFIGRYKLPYNSEGCYFDEATATVYHNQSLEFIGIISIILFLLTITTVVWIIKAIRKES